MYMTNLKGVIDNIQPLIVAFHLSFPLHSMQQQPLLFDSEVAASLLQAVTEPPERAPGFEASFHTGRTV